MKERTVFLADIATAKNSLSFTFAIDDLRFSTSYWYEGVDLHALRHQFGEAMENIIFHIAAFELNKVASLKPTTIDFGNYSHFVTPGFIQFWQAIFRNVWAQWRFENNLIDYDVPCIEVGAANGAGVQPIGMPGKDSRLLMFCGGGKDSLVSMRMLDRGTIEYDSVNYSSSIYGTSEQQHRIIERLYRYTKPRRHFRQWIFDDFLDSPVIQLRSEFGVQTVTAAETPSSIFGALPFVLAHGYRYVAVGHERSADTGQVRWSATGEDINHQWGKSYEAEVIINSYIRTTLVRDFSYFSILKPLYDVFIFSLLRRDLEGVTATHSCNVAKPWCRRCAKCCYVWLGYMAFLPRSIVQRTFGEENLFDVEENLGIFRSLLGVSEQLPFECIGQASESRLFFELCRLKGYRGAAIDMFEAHRGALDLDSLVAQHLRISWEESRIPDSIRGPLEKQWAEGLNEARAYIEEVRRGKG